MTSSLEEATGQHERVLSFLGDSLPSCRLTSEPLVDGYPPLLLMAQHRLMAAFAFPAGDTKRGYRELYGGFRRYYDQRRARLDALELSFVLCVHPDLPQLDEFRSQVETDVLFCRKFVISLTSPLGNALGRLPFLPLAPAGAQVRHPPSAQTYLQQHGIPAKLARHLAVPHLRGAENIAKDCIASDWDWNAKAVDAKSALDTPAGPERSRKSVRLESLTIRSFRAYRARQRFELGRAVTVLYGPNGFGKTSLFDALDFAATGSVGRLSLPPDRQRFSKTMAHLDGPLEEANVSLRFSEDDSQGQLNRRVSSPMRAVLDGRPRDRKAVLARLTGVRTQHGYTVEHLVRLFRSTHLFSQEHQELARDFLRKSALPSKVISHLLAFEDYERARDKAAQVSATMRRWMEEAKREDQRLASEVQEEQHALSGLDRTSQDLGDSAMPADALSSLRRRLREAGLSVGRKEADLLFVRECRAAIEARHGEVGARAKGLTALLDEVRNLAPAVHRVAELAARFEQLQAGRRSAEEALTAAEKIQAEAQVDADQAQARQTAARERSALLDWAISTRPRYADLRRQAATTALELEEKFAALRDVRELEATAAEDLRRHEKAAAETEDDLRTKKKTVAELERIVEGVHAWRTDRKRLVVLKEKHDQCEATLSHLSQSGTGSPLQLEPERGPKTTTGTRARRDRARPV